MLRRGLSTETQALEVCSRERTRISWVETPWGAREWCTKAGSRVPQPREPRRRCGPIGEARHHHWGGQQEEGLTAIGISFSAHGGLSKGRAMDWGVPLVWAKCGGGKPPQSSQTPEVGMACHHQGPVNRHHLWPSHLRGWHTGGHCNQAPPLVALLWECTRPASAPPNVLGAEMKREKSQRILQKYKKQ